MHQLLSKRKVGVQKRVAERVRESSEPVEKRPNDHAHSETRGYFDDLKHVLWLRHHEADASYYLCGAGLDFSNRLERF